VTLDEQGNVAEVNTASGPILLQGSAKDAIRKWKFRPVMVEGQAVKATGFVSFNFSL
jgi:outer membrane biosynthesis protein TonB